MNTNTAADIDFDYPDEADAPMPPVSIADQNQAESHLRALDAWRAQAWQIAEHATREIERAQRWRAEELRKVAPRIEYHESALTAYVQQATEPGKGKTIRLVNGTLKRVAGRDRVEVSDECALEAWGAANDVRIMRVKVEPDKTAIAKHIRDTGELPDGVDVVTGEDTFKIETE